MLEYAHFHRDELSRIFKKEVRPHAMLARYRDLFTIPYHNFDAFKIENDTSRSIQMVSIENGEIRGFIGADVDRGVSAVRELIAVSFNERSYTFSRDLREFFVRLLEGYNMNKINFSVVVGNPAEKQYDRMMELNGGRVVGIYKSHVRLIDNKVYDLKVYEIERSSGMKSFRKKDKR